MRQDVLSGNYFSLLNRSSLTKIMGILNVNNTQVMSHTECNCWKCTTKTASATLRSCTHTLRVHHVAASCRG